MRYVFVSDIHGCFDALQKALSEARFNRAKDTIVSVGDPFDRGPQSLEVLQFLMSCPHRILIAGNHDRRLRALLLGRGYFNDCDKANGVPATLTSFLNGQKMSPYVALHLFETSSNYAKTKKLLWKYFDECVFAAEWSNLIITHAWVPTNTIWVDKWLGKTRPTTRQDWRNANVVDWDDAIWSNSLSCYTHNVFPNKKLLIGHWGTYQFHEWANKKDIDNFTIYEDEHIIAIDGTTAFSGRVNTYIYETKEKPVFYDGKL